jgi:hypothetical protein
VRITERCCCGATIWISAFTDEQAAEALKNFRARHASCLPSHPALAVDDRTPGVGPHFPGHDQYREVPVQPSTVTAPGRIVRRG